jgi:lysophospholipid acyltransferase (LPLAT)-like uncharacterized protein
MIHLRGLIRTTKCRGVTDPTPLPRPSKRKSRLARWIRSILLFFAPALLRILLSTWRIRIENPHHLSLDGPQILVTWHENLAALTQFGLSLRPRLAILISASRDGDAGTDLAHRMGVKTVRGSSSRGGGAALLAMDRLMREHKAIVGILLDGPRGPRRQAKPGPSMLSAMVQIPVTPVAAYPSSCWRLRSWDRTLIPRPFALIRVILGPSIAPPYSTDRDELECHRQLVEDALLNISMEEDGNGSPTLKTS